MRLSHDYKLPNSIKHMRIKLLLLILLSACSDSDRAGPSYQNGEFITRKSTDKVITEVPSLPVPPPTYPWTVVKSNAITKHSFACKGSVFHPMLTREINGQKVYHFDCGGSQYHSLPIRDQKEFIYPVLIELLNYVQDRTGKKVIITSGHRCPEHNQYIDPSVANQTSKHQLGAEVDFYVEGMEKTPLKIAALLQEYYQHHESKDYSEFQRYEKSDTDVKTQPWYNKEIFIKLYQPHEGRNGDNTHTYPYISIQVRWDRDKKEKVNYSWDQAQKSFYRS